LGGETLQKYAEKMGLTSSVRFDGVSSAAGSLTAAGEPAVMVAWSAIGQHKDLVNPCSFLTMVGAIANGGQGALPYFVQGIDGGKWGTYQARTDRTPVMISTETATLLRQMMRNNVEDYYGDHHFPGLTVCAKSGTAEVGGDVKNALLTGFVADEEYPLAFFVVVEDGDYGRQTCVPIISKVLAACKAALDGE
jgi:peptidoglycan glycosyltransferase